MPSNLQYEKIPQNLNRNEMEKFNLWVAKASKEIMHAYLREYMEVHAIPESDLGKEVCIVKDDSQQNVRFFYTRNKDYKRGLIMKWDSIEKDRCTMSVILVDYTKFPKTAAKIGKILQETGENYDEMGVNEDYFWKFQIKAVSLPDK